MTFGSWSCGTKVNFSSNVENLDLTVMCLMVSTHIYIPCLSNGIFGATGGAGW